MTIAETIKTLRKTAGMSQEQLAEKLHVSRQAVTKWETEGGTPDIENLRAIAALFGITVDELLTGETKVQAAAEHRYESVTEYDIDEVKHYDMKFGSAKEVFLSGHPGEKLRIRLVSGTLASLQSDFKIKLDDTKRRLDLELLRKNGMSESASKEGLSIYAELPAAYLGKVECAVNAELVSLSSLDCERIELGGRNRKLYLDAVPGTVEVDSNLDMEIHCKSLASSLELNQLSACSKLYVPADAVFTAKAKGIGTRISYASEGKEAEPFDTPGAEKRIELNGMKSELVINREG